MSVKSCAAVANYRAKQIAALSDYLPVNAGDVGAIVDRKAFADAKTAVRDDTIRAYREVFGDLADETLLREMWAAEDTPAVTLVASTAVADPAQPLLAITFPADATPDEKVEAIMARLDDAWDEEDALDVPAPDEGDSPPGSPSTVCPPDGAPGAGTQDDDPALD